MKLQNRRSDELRRDALQIAIQLPDSLEDAREVIDAVAELLEGYMVKGVRPAWQRRILTASNRAPDAPRAIFWTVAIFLILAPVAVGLYYALGLQMAAVATFSVGVLLSGLVFGRRYGLLSAALALITHDVLISPPLFTFSTPTPLELIFAAQYLLCAVVAPTIARHADVLSAAATISCGAAARSSAEPSRG